MENIKRKSRFVILLFFLIIIIIGIIISVKYVNKQIKEQKSDDIKTNMLIIQAKIRLIKGESNVNKSNENYIGEKVSDLGDQEVIRFLESLKIENNDIQNYYLIKKEHLEIMGLAEEIKFIDEYYYIVNYETAEVIFRDGILLNNELKYKLSDMIQETQKKRWILYERIGVD